ncbi:fumarate hydratase [Mycoplasmatota bacterium WC44]
MKTINEIEIINAVEKLCLDANFSLSKKVLKKIATSEDTESSPIGKKILGQIIENASIAESEFKPMCQDTGIVVVFLEIGKVQFNFDIHEAVNEGVRRAYKTGYLRKSIVKHPLDRENTKDNTPAIIHTKITNTDNLKITIAPKGGGSENMSKLKMLTPAEGYQGVKDFIINTIKEAGGKTCPPIIVGVGIGGNLEKAALISKEALMRDIEDSSPDEINKKLEDELLEEINNLGVGPMGFGGNTTALAVKVNTYPCHIAALPVAVNLQCHAARHKSVIL